MASPTAYLMFFAWPVVTYVLYARLGPSKCLVVSFLLALAFLPSSFAIDFPLIPPFQRESVPALSFFLAWMLLRKKQARQVRGTPPKEPVKLIPKDAPKLARISLVSLLALLLICHVMTTATNGDPLQVVAGRVWLPGMGLNDLLSILNIAMGNILPFLFAATFLRKTDDQLYLLRFLVILAVCYTPFMYYELRMSPQIHSMVYGFFPHSFLQHIRNGGFRPLVFFPHGLRLAIFIAAAALAAAALWRFRAVPNHKRFLMAFGWLSVTLVLSNNLGATLLVMLFAPVVLFFPRRLMVLIPAVIGLIAIVYPTVRTSPIMDTDALVEIAYSYNEERGQSFWFRLMNEDLLLEKVEARPVWGWGNWGRQHQHDEETGEESTITDGYWIIVLGVFGYVGYVAHFGLLCLPMILLFLRRGPPDTMALALSMILAMNIIDAIPNSSVTNFTWLIAGALYGHCLQPLPARSGAKVPRRGAAARTRDEDDAATEPERGRRHAPKRRQRPSGARSGAAVRA